MKTATEQLIELAERLNPTGVIGDGMVAHFHELARRSRAELGLMPAVLDLGSVVIRMTGQPDGSIRFG